MKFKPLFDNVVVQKIPPPTKTDGGLFLPQSSDDFKYIRGKVLAVGKGSFFANGERKLLSVKIGDIVLLQRYAGQAVTIDKDQKEYLFIKESDVIAIIETGK